MRFKKRVSSFVLLLFMFSIVFNSMPIKAMGKAVIVPSLKIVAHPKSEYVHGRGYPLRLLLLITQAR